MATGTLTAVDQSFDFSDLAAFETGIPGSQLLVEYGFRTANGIPGSGSDLTSFDGSAILSYTYDVPEPAMWMCMTMGLGMLAWRRRQNS
jgi:hypothetical protein